MYIKQTFKNMLFNFFTLEMSKLRFREFKKPVNNY